MFNSFLETIERVNGFKETIGNFQWFLRQPSPLNVFLQSDHCHQWFFNGCWSCYHRFQWFSMVLYHWSNDAMVSMHRYGLNPTVKTVQAAKSPSSFPVFAALPAPSGLYSTNAPKDLL